MSLTLSKAKGRRGGEQEHFARLPVSVLESDACKTLEHAAFKVLVVIAAQFRGKHNGVMALTPPYAARFGINSKDTLYSSLKELKQRSLLIETRQGWRGVRNHFAMYALGWLPITHMDGQPLTTPDTTHIRRYLDWQPSAKISTSERTNSFPPTGKESPVSFPVGGPGSSISCPPSGKTSRYLDAGSIGSGSSSASEAFNPASARILKLHRAQPHLPVADLAKICRATVEQVQQALEGSR